VGPPTTGGAPPPLPHDGENPQQLPAAGIPRRSPIDIRKAVSGTPVPALDVTIPVSNEENELEQSLRRLHAYLLASIPHTFRITVADIASTDATLRIAERVAREIREVRVIRLSDPGRGNALRTAWLASESPVLAYMDVELSTDLAALGPLLAPLISGHSDLAIGTRLARGSCVLRSRRRKLISRGYNFLLHTLLGAHSATRSAVSRPFARTSPNGSLRTRWTTPGSSIRNFWSWPKDADSACTKLRWTGRPARAPGWTWRRLPLPTFAAWAGSAEILRPGESRWQSFAPISPLVTPPIPGRLRVLQPGQGFLRTREVPGGSCRRMDSQEEIGERPVHWRRTEECHSCHYAGPGKDAPRTAA